MLRKHSWLALAVVALCGLTNRAHAQYAYNPAAPIPVVQVAPAPPQPVSAPVVQFVDNHQQPEHTHSGVMGGATVYIFKPYFNQNPAFVSTTNAGAANAIQVSEEFDWNHHIAPAVWLGWTSRCGVGFRARYFHFDEDSEGQNLTIGQGGGATTTVTPPAGLSPVISPIVGVPPRGFQSPGILLQGGLGDDVLSFSSDLLIDTIDGEITYAHEWCRFGVVVSVGGRYLQLRQNYLATLVNVPTQGTSERSFLTAEHNFFGGGPTMSVSARWQIGRSGMAVYGTARGSILIGTSRTAAVFNETIIDPVNKDQSNQASTAARDNVTVPMGELEGGLEYSTAVGRTRFFLRGGAVNHTYFDGGSVSSKESNLSLFGGQLSVGLNY